MAIRTEQIDINNVGKTFLLRKDLKVLLMDVIKNMTEEEKEEIGLSGSKIPEKSQLEQLIAECRVLLNKATIGHLVGQYYKNVWDEFSLSIDEAVAALKGPISDMPEATSKLELAKKKFVLSVVTEEGVLIDGKWYGISPPTGELADCEWIALKIFLDKYWVSLEPIHPKHPLASSLIHLYGVFVPKTNRIYTRFDLEEDLDGLVDKLDGAIYTDIWFGGDKLSSIVLTEYLDKEIFFIQSEYNYVEADPPLIPESGFAWYGKATDMMFLPPTIDECKKKMNIVVALGRETEPEEEEKETDTTTSSTVYTVDNLHKVVSNVEPNTTISQFLAKIEVPEGATKSVLDAQGQVILITATKIIQGMSLKVVAKDGVTNSIFEIILINDNPDFDPDQPVIIGNRCYSVVKPQDASLIWVPTKIIGSTYISLSPVPAGFPNELNFNHLMGLYVPTENKVYTRFNLPQEVIAKGIAKVDGGIYNKIWFSNTDVSTVLNGYLTDEIFFIQSEYRHVEANPPLVPEAGDAWYGSADHMNFLPKTIQDCKKYLNVVAIFGQ